jgi:putative glutamine amidotransferase
MKNVASWIRESDAEIFAKVFSPYPDLRVWDARSELVDWEKMDGLLLTGGHDISGGYLRQEIPDPKLIHDPNPGRDAWEFTHLERALAAKLPVFAICRGFQVLNVALGGTLHLDIPGHDSHRNENVQPLVYESEARCQFANVNSSHHQSLDRVAPGLVIEARSATDGVIEQVHLREYPFAMGVQYHPERDPLYRGLFDDFVERVREG